MVDDLSLVIKLREVERLRSIGKSEKEINWDHALASLREERPPVKETTSREFSVLPLPDWRGQVKGKEWMEASLHAAWQAKPLTCPPRFPRCLCATGMRLWMWKARQWMKQMEGLSTPQVLAGSERPTPCVTATSMRKKRRVVVVGDSLLRSTGSLICWAGPLLREVCCIAGAQVKDITRKFPSLVQAWDYCLLLVFHVGGEVATGSLRTIKRDCRALDGW